MPPSPEKPAAKDTQAAPQKPAIDKKPDDQTAVAAPIEATKPIENNDAPADTDLTRLVDGLADVRATLGKGETPTAEQLDAVAKALEQLADKLGLSLDTPLSAAQLAAMATQPLSADATLSDQLSKTLASMVQSLMDSKATTDAQTLGAKLAALLGSLSEAKSAPNLLAELDTKITTKLDPALADALTRLLKPNAGSDTPATVLATPSLKLTQPALTGKSADAPTPAANSTAPATPTPSSADAKTDGGGTGKGHKKSDDQIGASSRYSHPDSKPDANSTPNQIGAQPPARPDAPATARLVPTVYQTNQQQINLPQIAFEMVRQVQHGNSRFQIRLDPAELGRVDVRLDIDKGGTVNARLIVDKAETLDLMQRDQRALQQALQQAGLDSSKTTLEFSLRQNNSGQQQNQPQGNSIKVFGGDTPDEPPAPSVKLFRGSLSASGINIIA
ncbi:flagellar hook-length control protein FliK [Devosia rhodophyticola]|uniref:Flagellar hook-length control protein FliK n=1 Tax=Devosia rhodophyticola TaxID=3026423 RepID=A0ABY7YUC4_9HYPH|nr:flagellar hook-length control protein FliK [Devosia rhodophyticola]WDR04968.1 flagellar hook-length control protein FliK [Devosia rhodophyticola]